MRIVEQHSHLNGWEHILVHKPHIWTDIQEVIATVDAENVLARKSMGRALPHKPLYSPTHLDSRFREGFSARGWHEPQTPYSASNVDLIRQPANTEPVEDQDEIPEAGNTPIMSYHDNAVVKDRIAVKVQLSNYSCGPYDLFMKHMAFYVGDVIDVGVEILPMKETSNEMPPGISYYEGELHNVARQGRGTPAVPLIIIGIAQ